MIDLITLAGETTARLAGGPLGTSPPRLRELLHALQGLAALHPQALNYAVKLHLDGLPVAVWEGDGPVMLAADHQRGEVQLGAALVGYSSSG